jgi:pilus assembly protein CpaC
MKIMSEPDLVTVSGRPAFIQVGGEYGYLVSNGTMGNTVSFKEYGTRVDFVPIVLGNGRLKLEVRGAVSEIDKSLTVGGVPALKNRVVDCGVELRAGQTLAIGGLVQQRVEAENKGLPLVSEVPYLGALFRRVEEQINEVELLILVTPELVEAMDASQVPPCGPGMQTTSPDDCELFLKGHLEVPNCCPSCQGAGCAGCGGSGLQARYNPSRPQNPAAVARAAGPNGEPAFIGPTGYDVIK